MGAGQLVPVVNLKKRSSGSCVFMHRILIRYSTSMTQVESSFIISLLFEISEFAQTLFDILVI